MVARSEAGARRLPLLHVCGGLLIAALSLGGVGHSTARAQSFGPDVGFPLAETLMPTRILVLDQERLFAESRFGRRVASEIDVRSREIASENRMLEGQLEREERELTELRPSLGPAEFRDRADAFNARVQRIRGEQDAKARTLSSFREAEQQRFLAALGPVLTKIAAEENAVAIMDRRLLLLAAESIDITETAIERVDLAVGEGETLGPAGGAARDGGAPLPGASQIDGGAPDTASPGIDRVEPGRVDPSGASGGEATVDPGADDADTGAEAFEPGTSAPPVSSGN